MVCIGQIHTRPERERADIARLSCTPYIRSHGDKEDTGVIPCQINKEFRVTSWILTKLGMFVVPVVLITHANF